jgi:hypothetical protein
MRVNQIQTFRCAQTWTVLREFVWPGWTCLVREMVDEAIIVPALALWHQLAVGRQRTERAKSSSWVKPWEWHRKLRTVFARF